ncbi:Mercuric resistance operon regulatory protein [Acaryochloris thomasi RCC1774]|uniref:Mercuric resistance operon regulatory protein n=1 Tax=Acaryochloris thomasi RCC1774 TaxID=1764569 RepID=A0A2W1JSL7_9CYAN|nr:heavy metal-responsive transcriptional regulator [Acaryochloris thomasi]PZD73632.1 Mercuric resistance operon regulatory protein [Acaryochloris thomasi RCC1774]
MRVSEVARQFDLNAQTLYFYERIGLIPSPSRNASGYRIFAEQDIERLSLIERAKALGLTLDEIKEILQLQEGQGLTCGEVHQRLLKKLQQIETTIAQLQKLREELLPLVQRCETAISQQQIATDCGIFQPDE